MVYINDQTVIVELEYWDAADYMDAISAMLFCLKHLDKDMCEAKIISDLCFLIEQMLPHPDQIDLTRKPER